MTHAVPGGHSASLEQPYWTSAPPKHTGWDDPQGTYEQEVDEALPTHVPLHEPPHAAPQRRAPLAQVGAVVVVAAAVLARTPGPRLGLLTGAVGVCAAVSGDGRTALTVARGMTCEPMLCDMLRAMMDEMAERTDWS